MAKLLKQVDLVLVFTETWRVIVYWDDLVEIIERDFS